VLVALSIFAFPASASVEPSKQSVPRIVVTGTGPDGTPWMKTGSGFAISSDLVLTNYHVAVAPNDWTDTSLSVVGPRGSHEVTRGNIISADADSDLALLRVDGASFRPLPIATSRANSDIAVFAVGYPGAIDDAYKRDSNDMMTPSPPETFQGSVSNYNSRSPRGYVQAVVNHSAPISKGNSGGPLVDECGRVIAINTWNDSATGRFGFSVASSEVLSFLKKSGFAAVIDDSLCVSAAQRAMTEAAAARETSQQVLAEAEQKRTEAAARLDAAERALEEQRLHNERLSQQMVWLAMAGIGIAAAAAYFISQRVRNSSSHASTAAYQENEEPNALDNFGEQRVTSGKRFAPWFRQRPITTGVVFGSTTGIIALSMLWYSNQPETSSSETRPFVSTDTPSEDVALDDQVAQGETALDEATEPATGLANDGAQANPAPVVDGADRQSLPISPGQTDMLAVPDANIVKYACAFSPKHSQSDTDSLNQKDQDFTFNTKTACLNERTQYARDETRLFIRARINQRIENSVYVVGFEPGSGVYMQDRYELLPTDFERFSLALAARQKNNCDANAEAAEARIWNALSRAQSGDPAERLVWICKAQ
jgi:V8-like Glu-specific endopeptidase